MYNEHITPRNLVDHAHVHVGRLSQEASALEEEAELPCSPALLTVLFVNDDGVEQSSTANSLDQGRVERANS